MGEEYGSLTETTKTPAMSTSASTTINNTTLDLPQTPAIPVLPAVPDNKVQIDVRTTENATTQQAILS